MKRFILDRKTIFPCCFLGCLFSSNAFAYVCLDHLATPGNYDNVGGSPESPDYGQTFIATASSISGFQVYIGDPDRQDVAGVNNLRGPADLILYNASNLSAAVEIARENNVVSSDSPVGGQSLPLTFTFTTPVSVNIGARYFFTIHAGDQYGIGLRSVSSSTYEGGAEAWIENSTSLVIAEHVAQKDLSFAVLSPGAAPVPIPSTMLLLGSGLVGLLGLRRRFKKSKIL